MVKKRIKLDVFSLVWVDLQIHNSRSTGCMWVDFNQKLDKSAMEHVLSTMIKHYPVITSRLVKEGNSFYFEYEEQVSNEEVTSRLIFTERNLDDLIEHLVMNEIDLLADPLYEIYICSTENKFSVLIHGAHLMGDGVSTASFMSLILYNYYLQLQGKTLLYPKMKYDQLLSYVESLKYTRFRKIFTPRPFRFIRGIYYYLRLKFRNVESMAFNIPIPRNEKLLTIEYTFNETFRQVLTIVKDRYKVNSNHLMLAIFSYAKMKHYGYNHTQVTYPINVRNEYGLVIGNLIIPNSIKVKMEDDFELFLIKFKRKLNRERRKLGPYFVVSLGRFINPTIEDVHDNMSQAKGANIRFSNMGRLPSANMREIPTDVFETLPLSNYRLVATPLGTIAVHPFATSLRNKHLNHYYLTILHSQHTKEDLNSILKTMEEVLADYYMLLSSS